ncbi:4-aminobutyrate aminotransferase [Microvirga aerilata]|uniref:4-aminobutyrate aminotransferase n=1 Tax=Microvirga aerilata TaxID=670292 RepID=A0A936ZAG7_9HYPH|nr:4-aminobutyrate aminotransferase [Microvirga aerilata]MBL0407016.1 4-aminobutyrate aminotransferase [Microvirga aerilata]
MGSMKPSATMIPSLACVVFLAGTAALAQTNSAHRSAEAVAGKSLRLGTYGNVQKDCTSGRLPTVRVLTPPKHGELNVRSGNLKAGRITRCPNLRATAQGIFYQASPKYSGTDEISYEVKSASGKVETHTVRITVKDVPASDTKPEQDTEF